MMSRGTTSPACAPAVTITPFRFRHLRLRVNTSPPTCSMTTSTPRPPVRSRTRSAKFSRAVVDDVVRAQRLGALELPVAACGGEYGGPRESCHLDRGAADAGACRLDEDALAGLQPAPVDEHVPGGTERDLARGGVLEADVRRQRIQVGDRHFHVLGVAAGQVEPEVAFPHAQVVATAQAELACPARKAASHPDAVPFLERAGRAAGCRTTDFCDLTRELPSQDVRKGDRNARGAGPVIQVHVVDAHRAHAHHRFAGPGRGRGGFLAHQDFRTTEPVEPGHLHRHAPLSLFALRRARMSSGMRRLRYCPSLRSPWNRPSATMTLPRSTVSTGQAPTSLPSQGV